MDSKTLITIVITAVIAAAVKRAVDALLDGAKNLETTKTLGVTAKRTAERFLRIQQDSDHRSRNPHNSVCDVQFTHTRELSLPNRELNKVRFNRPEVIQHGGYRA